MSDFWPALHIFWPPFNFFGPPFIFCGPASSKWLRWMQGKSVVQDIVPKISEIFWEDIYGCKFWMQFEAEELHHISTLKDSISPGICLLYSQLCFTYVKKIMFDMFNISRKRAILVVLFHWDPKLRTIISQDKIIFSAAFRIIIFLNDIFVLATFEKVLAHGKLDCIKWY